jgi:methoxymalonate biosynthesis acyl carrier protein
MSNSGTDIIDALNNILAQEGKSASPNTNLFEADVIDSLGMLDLVEAVEAHFGFAIDQSDITMDNFASLEKIADLVALKQAGG